MKFKLDLIKKIKEQNNEPEINLGKEVVNQQNEAAARKRLAEKFGEKPEEKSQNSAESDRLSNKFEEEILPKIGPDVMRLTAEELREVKGLIENNEHQSLDPQNLEEIKNVNQVVYNTIRAAQENKGQVLNLLQTKEANPEELKKFKPVFSGEQVVELKTTLAQLRPEEIFGLYRQIDFLNVNGISEEQLQQLRKQNENMEKVFRFAKYSKEDALKIMEEKLDQLAIEEDLKKTAA